MADPNAVPPMPVDSADPTDMSNKYNTPLSPPERDAFDKWLQEMQDREGRDVSADQRDYDLQGLFKSLGGRLPEPGHGPDTFKKPSHPTFSNESKYHGFDGFVGGSWQQDGAKQIYRPSKTNLEMHGAEGLRQYFQQVEPDVTLVGVDTAR